jgi:hypothetical protein
MATAKQQLLANMNPQMARLLDNQMRDQQVAQRSQGAGMLAGLTQAYTGMGDLASRALGAAPMGANEMQAITAKKQHDELIKQARLDKTAKEAESRRRWDAEFNIKKTNSSQQTALFNQQSAQNEITLEAARNKLARDGQYSLAVDDIVQNIQGMSDTEKLFVGSMDNESALEYLTTVEKTKQAKFKNVLVVNDVTRTFFPESRPSNESSTALNRRYLGAIAAYNKAGMTQEAATMEEERKARIEQRKTVEQREQDVKDKWDSNVGIRNLNKKIGAASQGLALLEQGGGLSELAAQISFFKVNDPESVVKESELEMANQADGILSSLEAAASRKGGSGILSSSLRKQLKDFFTLSGSLAVDGYNETVEEQKLRYKGRDMDVNFMFGGEKTLSAPDTTASYSNYYFDLNNIATEIKPEIKEALSNKFNELSLENKKELNGFYRTVANDPAGLAALQRKAIEKFGFDALGYKLHTGG